MSTSTRTFIDVGGVRLHVAEQGDRADPPVLFLHGVQSSGETYGFLPREITEGRWILRLDHRGHGYSGHCAGSYLRARYVADVVEVLQRHVGRPAVVVGQSLGGTVGWSIAQSHPQLLNGVVAEDPPLYLSDPDRFARSGVADMIRLLEGMRERWVADGLDEEQALDAFAATEAAPGTGVTQSAVYHQDAIAAQGRAFLQLDPGVQLTARDNRMLLGLDLESEVRVPLRILAADEERGGVFTIADAARMASTHRDVEVIRFPGASHRLHSELAHREEYVRRVVEFLDLHAR